MKPKDFEKLGKLAFHQCLIPITKPSVSKNHLIVGFDTEYDSETRELLSLQFSHMGNADWYIVQPGEHITWEKLESILLGFLKSWGVCINKRHCRAIKLISYWSLAETQHIQDLSSATVFETSIGVDFTWRGSGGRTLEIIDLMKFFNNPAQPLAKVAKAFGFQKLDWNRGNVSRKDMEHEDFKEYAINDAVLCEDIFNALRGEYLNGYGVDILRTRTPASTSSNIFRYHYLRDKFTQPNVRLRRLALLCTWGGRNEAFQRGTITGDIYEYDAFSEYPNSAINIGVLPNGCDWLACRSLDDVLQNHGFARVQFRFPSDCSYPCLPVFAESRLYYPQSGETFCTNAEIQLAFELGAEITLVEGYYYRTGTDALARYMADFLEKRQAAKAAGDAIQSHVIKLSINSLIGKFVQRVVKTDLNVYNTLSEKSGIPVHLIRRMDETALAETCKAYEIDPETITKVSVGNSFYPEWNGLILGFARAATSRFIQTIASEKHSPLVCSTDSVIFKAGDNEPKAEYYCSGIRFERREKGDTISVLRTRLYRIRAGEETVKLAHHAIARAENAHAMFDLYESNPTAERFGYNLRRIVKYRESVVGRDREYGADAPVQRSVRMGYDHKRQILPGGVSQPWQSVEQKILAVPG